MKHTPGPWELQAGRGFKTSSGEFYITYGKDKYGNPNFDNFCELDRNARLIAAAPEMLEALKLIIGKAEAGKLSNELGKHVKLENIIADCQAIIAKAEGR